MEPVNLGRRRAGSRSVAGSASREPLAALPLALDSFVGRDRDVEQVGMLVARSRLVTLTGPPGVGKTRLALEVASSRAVRAEERAILVRLDAIAEPALLDHCIAAAFNLREVPGRGPVAALAAHLQARRVLLILDNAEHLLADCARVVETLLRSCESLHVLVTSQEALGVSGERVWPVSPLPIADNDFPDRMRASPAVRLFADRAAAIVPGWEMDDAAVVAVGTVCRQLDGIPLAIELAAARVAVLAPAEIAARLGNRFSLLTGRSETVTPRHQTLKAAIDWSYDLLTEAERAVLRRLSVFVGGASLDAIEATCAGDGVATDAVFDLVAGLVAKSLVVADTTPADSRYRLLESVAAYGKYHLAEAGELLSVRHRHAWWHCHLVERAEAHLAGPSQEQWLGRLSQDIDNVTAALDWAISEGDGVLALRLAGALSLFWRIRGHCSEGLACLTRALDLGVDAPAAVRAKALWGAGFLSLMTEEESDAVSLLEESLELWRGLDDTAGVARSLLLLGNCKLFADASEAVSLLDQSTELARQAGDGWCLSHSLALAGVARTHLGLIDEARALLTECLAVAGDGGDNQGRRIGLLVLGDLALSQGEYGSAENLLSEGLTLTRHLGETYGMAGALCGLAEVASSRGHFSTACAHLDEALALDREAGSMAGLTESLTWLGRVAWMEGRQGDANEFFQQAVGVMEEAGLHRPPPLLGLADVALASGDLPTAGRLLDEALELARSNENKRDEAASRQSQAKLARAEGQLERAAVRGREALELRWEIGHRPGVIDCLELLAGIFTTLGPSERAARLFAAAQAARHELGYVRHPVNEASYQSDVALVRRGLSAEALATVDSQGATMNLKDAVSYALRRRGPRPSGEVGWASLTKAELDVVALVAEGLSNPEVGARLFISRRTVGSHLAHVFPKLGVTSRHELVQEAARRGLPTQKP